MATVIQGYHLQSRTRAACRLATAHVTRRWSQRDYSAARGWRATMQEQASSDETVTRSGCMVRSPN